MHRYWWDDVYLHCIDSCQAVQGRVLPTIFKYLKLSNEHYNRLKLKYRISNDSLNIPFPGSTATAAGTPGPPAGRTHWQAGARASELDATAAASVGKLLPLLQGAKAWQLENFFKFLMLR